MALSCGSPRLAVNQHSDLWSPDLPRRRPSEQAQTAMPRSPDRLTQAVILDPPAELRLQIDSGTKKRSTATPMEPVGAQASANATSHGQEEA